jgi:uncharacterized protein YpmS
MKRRWRWTIGALLFLLAAAGMALFLLYRATQYVPPAYEQALQLEPRSAARGSDEMLKRAADLSNRLRKEGAWQALFTQQQINGWLAVDLPQNHPESLPPSLSDPRVVIEQDQVVLFCRYEADAVRSVLSLTLEPYVPSPNVLAVRIRGARAGRVPLPLDDVLKAISRWANDANVPLQWKQTDGDPVAQFTFDGVREAEGRQVRIDTLEVRPGEVFVAGATQRASQSNAPRLPAAEAR